MLLLIFTWWGCGESEPPINVSLKEDKHAQGIQTSGKEPLRLAIASVVSPDKAFKYYDEMIDYLSVKLHQPIKLIQRESYKEINDLMKLGKIDVAMVCSGAYVLGKSDFGMELLVAPEMMGQTVYYSYIIVSHSADAQVIQDLKGQSFAFTDPLSNSGRLSPTYILKTQLGESPETFFKEIKFTYSHDLSIKAVAQGKVYGAAVDSLVYDYFKKTEPELIAKTKVIHISPSYGISPVVVRPGLESAMKEQLREVFINMNMDTTGKQILDKLMIDRFVVVNDDLYDSIRKMEEALK
jgi:phosphonate transport system substrate-binding protein